MQTSHSITTYIPLEIIYPYDSGEPSYVLPQPVGLRQVIYAIPYTVDADNKNISISFLYKKYYYKNAVLSRTCFANLILFVHIWARKRERSVFFQELH